MRNTAFFLAGLALILLQANLFRPVGFVHGWVLHLSETPGFWHSIGYHDSPLLHLSSFVPSLVLPLIVYMGVHEYSLARGAGVAFVLGYATGLTAIAPVGLFTFTFVALYVLARGAGVRLASQTKWLQIVLGLSFSLVHSVMLLVLLAIFGPDPYVPRAIYRFALPHAFATAVIAPAVFAIAQRIHAATIRGSDEVAVRS